MNKMQSINATRWVQNPKQLNVEKREDQKDIYSFLKLKEKNLEQNKSRLEPLILD